MRDTNKYINEGGKETTRHTLTKSGLFLKGSQRWPIAVDVVENPEYNRAGAKPLTDVLKHAEDREDDEYEGITYYKWEVEDLTKILNQQPYGLRITNALYAMWLQRVIKIIDEAQIEITQHKPFEVKETQKLERKMTQKLSKKVSQLYNKR